VTRSHSTFTGRAAAAVAALSALLFTAGWGDQVLQGRGASYLVVTVLQAASGAKPETFSTVLQSDVVTNGGIFEDPGRVTLQLAMKDPTSIAGPSDTNAITINRYHVDFVRSDGRNTQGVDVPFAFDGAMTGTITGATSSTLSFTIVRAQAKLEAPLMALRNLGGALAISTIAQITFYGHDQAGNAVSVTGSISINFADWADPA
jgi:hypothetical protein